MALAAVGLRAAAWGITWIVHGVGPDAILDLRVGHDYLAYARFLAGEDGAPRPFALRLFPGYPALIAIPRLLGVPVEVGAASLNAAAVAAVPGLSAVVFRDRRLGWFMAVLTPSLLLYSTIAMSEATFLALALAGLVWVGRSRPGAGGLALGVAGAVRPVACFAALAAAAGPAIRRRWREVAILGASAAAVVLVAILAVEASTGDAWISWRTYAGDERAYAGSPFAWPFESLVRTPLEEPVAAWKVAYVWAHAAAALGGCALLAARIARDGIRDADDRDRLAAVWLAGNTAFVLCVGGRWGFHELHRFVLPALPALAWAYRPWLPRGRLAWTAIGAASFAVAVFGLWNNGGWGL